MLFRVQTNLYGNGCSHLAVALFAAEAAYCISCIPQFSQLSYLLVTVVPVQHSALRSCHVLLIWTDFEVDFQTGWVVLLLLGGWKVDIRALYSYVSKLSFHFFHDIKQAAGFHPLIFSLYFLEHLNWQFEQFQILFTFGFIHLSLTLNHYFHLCYHVNILSVILNKPSEPSVG